MERIDWTMIDVAAPGLRPTASDAFMPMMPTAMAAPRAARAMWRLPVITLLVLPWWPALLTGTREPERRRLLVRDRGFSLVMLADQQREHGGQQHEHQRLNQADQQFE